MVMNKNALIGVGLAVSVLALFVWAQGLMSQPDISDEMAVQIVQYQYVKKPNAVVPVSYNGETYIVTVLPLGENDEPTLIVLKKVADLWQEQPQTFTLTCSTNDCPTDAKKVSVGGHTYIFFTTESSGNALGTVYFNLFSPIENHIYTMSVFGALGNINQLEPAKSDVTGNQAVYDYLIQQIAESPQIAHISEQNLDVNSVDNAVRNWLLSNPDVHDVMRKGYLREYELVFPEYSDNLIDSDMHGSVNFDISNNQYRVASFFKEGVYAHDKIRNKYFIVWFPPSVYDWIPTGSFVEPTKIRLIPREDCFTDSICVPFEIDLKTKKLTY